MVTYVCQLKYSHHLQKILRLAMIRWFDLNLEDSNRLYKLDRVL